ncbi:MAG TPA: GNAT family N-acetyltransferase [Dehalococcoidia bacterium]|nr:GNAT family N-acetyltransferase [Dehalococcoidia bacterium]
MKPDCRACRQIEKDAGFSLQTFPDEGVCVRVSDMRTDEPKNRLFVQQVTGKNGVLVTGIPRIVSAASDCAQSMTDRELFSPLGLAEMKRVLPPADAAYLDSTYALDFVLTRHERFHAAWLDYRAVALGRKDIPTEQHDLRMAERRPSETDDFTWAFACYHDEPDVPAKRLAQFGFRCASIAVMMWNGSEDIAVLGVETEEALRGQGYGLAAVSAATQWILEQGAVAWYGAYTDNIASLRIARRLGFSPVCQSFRA